MGFVKDHDIRAAAALPDVDGEENELEDTIICITD